MDEPTSFIAFANQKGGRGRARCAQVTAAAGEGRRRILAVDVDPQADATSMLGAEHHGRESSLVAVGHERMADVELSLAGAMMREQFLSEALAGHLDRDDAVFIDCPPNLGLVTVTALVACSRVVGVVSIVDRNAYTDLLALVAIGMLQGHGVELELAGVARTQVNRDRLAYRAPEEEIRAAGHPLFETEVPLAAIFHNAGAAAQPSVLYAPDHPGPEAVRRLTREILTSVPGRGDGVSRLMLAPVGMVSPAAVRPLVAPPARTEEVARFAT